MRFLISLFTLIFFTVSFGCKTKKGAMADAPPPSPYTDTIKIAVNYQLDSLEVFVKKIIVNDSLFALNDETVDYTIQHTEQKDSILFITLTSFNACAKTDFALYQSNIVLKTYPPRLRMRISRTEAENCEEKPAAYTLAVDIRDILKNHPEAHIMFNGFSRFAYIKQY